MDGWWKNESHSLSQSNTSNYLGNGSKKEWSFVFKFSGYFLIYMTKLSNSSSILSIFYFPYTFFIFYVEALF